MGQVDGLIIPRTYNDYFSRSDPAAIRQLVAQYTDTALSTTSELPVQNKVVKAGLDSIGAMIPAQASAQNQLADKDFVNSSIGTNTANYISDNGEPFASVAALEAYSGTVTNNDYAFVTGTDAAGNTYYDRYKATVSGASVTWAKEYRLNNSSFTAAQWAAISSGITAAKVAQYDAGVTPVDVVESGNLHAVSSNAVYEYSNPQTTIIESTVKRTVTLEAGKVDWYGANLSLPSIPENKRLIRYIPYVSQSNTVAVISGFYRTGRGIITPCIFCIADSDVTCDIWWAAEVADK